MHNLISEEDNCKMTSLMGEIAKMYGLELEEFFQLTTKGDMKFKFTQGGLIRLVGGCDTFTCLAPLTLAKLLAGEEDVVYLPFNPSYGQTYYRVYWSDEDFEPRVTTDTYASTYSCNCMDKDMGNCFKNKEEAESKKYEIYKRLTGKDWEDRKKNEDRKGNNEDA